MNKKRVHHQAVNYLEQVFQKEDFIKSAIFLLFEESLQKSANKTQLMREFIKTCNEEFERAYLKRNAIYLELKDFIKYYNEFTGLTGQEYAKKTISSTKKTAWIFKDVIFKENDIITPLEMDRIQSSIISTVIITKDTDYIYFK